MASLFSAKRKSFQASCQFDSEAADAQQQLLIREAT
jgi:hypothetical protein